MLLTLFNHRIMIAVAVLFALPGSSCTLAPETSFFSKFSVRQLVEDSKSSSAFTCDPAGGGGGGTGIGSRAGGFGGSHFNSHKSDSVACRLKSNEPFDETTLFSALKLEVERVLHENGLQITDNGSSGAANFYFAYALKNVRGRVQVSGTRIGTDYYDLQVVLDETGD